MREIEGERLPLTLRPLRARRAAPRPPLAAYGLLSRTGDRAPRPAVHRLGASVTDATGNLRRMWRRGQAFAVDLLGEATVTEAEAEALRRALRRRRFAAVADGDHAAGPTSRCSSADPAGPAAAGEPVDQADRAHPAAAPSGARARRRATPPAGCGRCCAWPRDLGRAPPPRHGVDYDTPRDAARAGVRGATRRRGVPGAAPRPGWWSRPTCATPTRRWSRILASPAARRPRGAARRSGSVKGAYWDHEIVDRRRSAGWARAGVGREAPQRRDASSALSRAPDRRARHASARRSPPTTCAPSPTRSPYLERPAGEPRASSSSRCCAASATSWPARRSAGVGHRVPGLHARSATWWPGWRTWSAACWRTPPTRAFLLPAAPRIHSTTWSRPGSSANDPMDDSKPTRCSSCAGPTVREELTEALAGARRRAAAVERPAVIGRRRGVRLATEVVVSTDPDAGPTGRGRARPWPGPRGRGGAWPLEPAARRPGVADAPARGARARPCEQAAELAAERRRRLAAPDRARVPESPGRRPTPTSARRSTSCASTRRERADLDEPSCCQVPGERNALAATSPRGVAVGDRALELPARDPLRDDGRGPGRRATRSCSSRPSSAPPARSALVRACCSRPGSPAGALALLPGDGEARRGAGRRARRADLIAFTGSLTTWAWRSTGGPPRPRLRPGHGQAH